MAKFVHFVAFLVGCFAFITQTRAAPDLTLLRGGVGITGAPRQFSGSLDSNGNGRRELLVAGRWHLSIVEEDPNPRGYREIARLDAPDDESFTGALLVEVPSAAPALLLQWSERLELRDAATLRVKGVIDAMLGPPALGDVDGDGFPEIVAGIDGSLELFDPITLASRGSVPLDAGQSPGSRIAIADIVGDARDEVVFENGRAYTVTRNGGALSLTEVWASGDGGTWVPYAVDIDGHAAIVLHDAFGFSAKLATFRPVPSLRTLVPAYGPSFTPRFADANGDGRVDIIVATNSEVRALDMTTGATLWQRNTTYEPPYIGLVFSPVTADLNGDGTIEVAWADTSYDSGVVAISAPLVGAPRWRSDPNQARVTDWTRVERADGSSSIAYLTYGFQSAPSLGSLGFLDGTGFADGGGSAVSWLPGYDGIGKTMQQRAVTSLPLEGHVDALVVAGAEVSPSEGSPIARWLWTFDGTGALLSSRKFMSSIDPQRIVAAQVMDRPERQLVVAGFLPAGTSGATTQTARVEVVDYATGTVLWQSAPLPSYDGAPMTKLDIADLDADGRLDVVVAYGENVVVLTPSAGAGVVSNYVAQTYSLLDRGAGRSAKLATSYNANLAIYDGIAAVPDKTFVLPRRAFGIALFAQAPDDELMFATTDGRTVTLQRYADGAVVATSSVRADRGFLSLAAMDLDGDHRIDLIGSNPGFFVWRLDNDYIFRARFD